MTASLRRNLELKARDPWPQRSRDVCRNLGARDLGMLWQRDTYFMVHGGRLKLREQEPGEAHLIHYDRADELTERVSSYRIAPVSDAAAMLCVLRACLPERVTVTKRRHVYLSERVRIHLDDVERLGSFIELEAVASDDSDLVYEHKLITRLRDAFQISDELLVPDGYGDLLEAKYSTALPARRSRSVGRR